MFHPISPKTPQLPTTHTGDISSAGVRFDHATPLSAEFLADLAATGVAQVAHGLGVDDGGRDWWSPSAQWSFDNIVPARAAIKVSPTSTEEVAAVLRCAHHHQVPVTAMAGRSGVLGGTITLFGGIALDLTQLTGIESLDTTSQIAEVWAGTWGDAFEEALQSYGFTAGHWPQSMALATVGGWVACRGAGQLSTRYGKIEDIVAGLEVVLANGTVITTGRQPRQAVGPDCTQLFVGSEGTLGVITRVWLKVHRMPTYTEQTAFGFDSFTEALGAMREIVQRGANPAVLRLYDHWESMQNLGCDGQTHALLVWDEGPEAQVKWNLSVAAEVCAGARPMDPGLVDTWLEHRNRIPDLAKLGSQGYVWDTMEVSGSWAVLDEMYTRTVAAMSAVEHNLVASAHQSHSYLDGGCLYFTFAGKPPREERESFYQAVWDVGARTVLECGGSLSHHHGVGLHRGYLMREALGEGFGVLEAIKHALDPNGILNPGKLGLTTPFGLVEWGGAS